MMHALEEMLLRLREQLAEHGHTCMDTLQSESTITASMKLAELPALPALRRLIIKQREQAARSQAIRLARIMRLAARLLLMVGTIVTLLLFLLTL